MLIYDSESLYIPAEEQEVAAVYRSSSAVALDGSESLPSCEAFVCIVVNEQREHVFAALHARDIKKNLVYFVEPPAGGPSATESQVKRAFTFVEAMGFSMQAVNLKFGKAMREVVLRSIPVLLSREGVEKIRKEKNAELSELQRLVSESEGPAEETDPGIEPDTKRARERRSLTANAAARKLAQEKSAEDMAAAIGESVRKFLQQVNASAMAESESAERERLREENAVLEKRAAELASAVRRLQDEAEKDRAEAESRIVKLEAELNRIAVLEQALEDKRKEVAAEKGRGKELAKEKKALEKRILELKKTLQARSVEEGKNADAAALMQAEERIARLEQEVRETREDAESERFERELLVREKAAALRRVEELERERGAVAGDSEESKGDEEPGGIQKASDCAAADDERVAALQQALERAEERSEFLRLELERLAAAKAAVENRLTEGAPAAPRNDGTPGLPAGLPSPSPPSVRRPPPKGAFFHVDWDLEIIEYGSPEEVLEIHESMSMSQLSLEGYHSQHCSAWIIALRKGESRQVYVAFGLSESGRNLIYSPAKTVRNEDDYRRALREAVKFLEVVGYLPEKMPLGKAPPGDMLTCIPVLKGPR